MNREELVLTSFSDLVNKLVLLNKHTMEEQLGGYTSSEVHAVEYLAKHDDCNVTRLADAFCMTRSALSKVTKKLMDKGLVETYRKPDNKKEVYVALTAKGRDVAAVHDAAHEAFGRRDEAVFQQFSDEEFERVLAFADAYRDHLEAELRALDDGAPSA